jgi:SAM-dependent methyltransferase
MAHPAQFNFVDTVKNKFPEYFTDSLVLEIGSLNINGSVRQFFTDCVYIGVDVAPGPNVDVVSLGHEYSMPAGSFDTVISCECFEHDPYWRQTFTNMLRLTRPKGLVIFSCASTGRAEHGTRSSEPESSPLTVGLGWDYYKNLTEQDFTAVFDLDSFFSEYKFTTNNVDCDLYFYGIKRE